MVYQAIISEPVSQVAISNDVLQVCIWEFYTKCHHNEGCIVTVMLRGDIYSVSGFYHITNGNHRVINTQIKGGCHIIKPGVMGCHQGVINGLKSAL